ncbi:MAG: aminopeptidase, partial [Sphaerochaetaceae bacterium]
KEMGFEAFSQPIAFLTGGTDAAEAAKVGVKATTLMAMPWGNSERAAAYHTPNDVVEAIEPLAVEVALSIAIKFIENLDSRE